MQTTELPTQDAVVRRIRERRQHDLLGFEVSDLLTFLDYDHARPFLQRDPGRATWEQESVHPETREGVIEMIREYMPVAWEAANECRALGALRSLHHFTAWTWLVGDTTLSTQIITASESYRHYGKEILVLICEHYAFDWQVWDDDCWRDNPEDSCVTAAEALGRK